jgi:hypothetical protein
MNYDIAHILQSNILYKYTAGFFDHVWIGVRMFSGVWSIINRISLERFIITGYKRYITNQHTVSNGSNSAGFIEYGEFLDWLRSC